MNSNMYVNSTYNMLVVGIKLIKISDIVRKILSIIRNC